MKAPIRRLQLGFTLIELMIVVAIIGILAAIAVPQYQVFTIRARVAEGLALADAARTHVADIAGTGNAQANPAGYSLGFFTPGPTVNVANAGASGIAIDPNTGAITITYTPSVAAPGANTLTITPYTAAGLALPAAAAAAFTPPKDPIQWQCRAAGSVLFAAGSVAGTLGPQYAPSQCR